MVDALDINWSGVLRSVNYSSAAEKFAGSYLETAATIDVTLTTLTSTGHGFRFVSDPAQTTVNFFSQIGQERNGAFF